MDLFTEQIFDSINTIVSKSLENAKYDKTIKGIVSRIADEDTNLYEIKYNDIIIKARGQKGVNYAYGDEVYVLYPKNDNTEGIIVVSTSASPLRWNEL